MASHKRRHASTTLLCWICSSLLTYLHTTTPPNVQVIQQQIHRNVLWSLSTCVKCREHQHPFVLRFYFYFWLVGLSFFYFISSFVCGKSSINLNLSPSSTKGEVYPNILNNLFLFNELRFQLTRVNPAKDKNKIWTPRVFNSKDDE